MNIQLILEWLPHALSWAYKKSNSSVRPFYTGSCAHFGEADGICLQTSILLRYFHLSALLPLIKAMFKLHDLKKAFRLEDIHSGLLINDTGLVPAEHRVDPGRIFICMILVFVVEEVANTLLW